MHGHFSRANFLILFLKTVREELFFVSLGNRFHNLAPKFKKFSIPYCVVRIVKLPHTEVKLYSEVKYQTGLSSFRVSCKHALKNIPAVSQDLLRIAWNSTKIALII